MRRDGGSGEKDALLLAVPQTLESHPSITGMGGVRRRYGEPLRGKGRLALPLVDTDFFLGLSLLLSACRSPPALPAEGRGFGPPGRSRYPRPQCGHGHCPGAAAGLNHSQWVPSRISTGRLALLFPLFSCSALLRSNDYETSAGRLAAW